MLGGKGEMCGPVHAHVPSLRWPVLAWFTSVMKVKSPVLFAWWLKTHVSSVGLTLVFKDFLRRGKRVLRGLCVHVGLVVLASM